jgi:hypothetical protein
MKTTTIGACRWPPGDVAVVVVGGVVEDDGGGGVERTEVPELAVPPPAHPEQTTAATHTMILAAPCT